MDEIDYELIKLLQENSQLSITKLSQMINLSRPSTKERIDKMVERGIIEQFTAIVDPKKIGRKIVFYIEIRNINVSSDYFVEKMCEEEIITEIHAVTGKNNFIMKASAPDIETMNDLLEDMMKYGSVETSIVVSSPVKRKVLLPFTD